MRSVNPAPWAVDLALCQEDRTQVSKSRIFYPHKMIFLQSKAALDPCFLRETLRDLKALLNHKEYRVARSLRFSKDLLTGRDADECKTSASRAPVCRQWDRTGAATRLI